MRIDPPRSTMNSREASPGAWVTKIGALTPLATRVRPRMAASDEVVDKTNRQSPARSSILRVILVVPLISSSAHSFVSTSPGLPSRASDIVATRSYIARLF